MAPLVLAVAILLGAAAAGAAAATSEPDTAAIVAGTTVSDTQFATDWPFVVAIIDARSRSQRAGAFCAGVLIDDQHVLTAAHCLSSYYRMSISVGPPDPALPIDGLLTPAGLKVVATSRTLSTTSLGSGARRARDVADYFIHPPYVGSSQFPDVAVLRLAAPIPGAATIALVQPGDAGAWGAGAGGIDALTASWGTRRIGAPDTNPTTMRQATIHLRSDRGCSTSLPFTFDRAVHLCGAAASNGDGQRTRQCTGDNGAPLVVETAGGERRLAGVTSQFVQCIGGPVSVFARLDALRSWIDSIPGATDGGMAVGGPSGVQAVRNLDAVSVGYRRVRLNWTAATTGPAPDRYVIHWRPPGYLGPHRSTMSMSEVRVGTTTSTSFEARVPATYRSRGFWWSVRPVLPSGAFGPAKGIYAGPAPDRSRPTSPGTPIVSQRGRHAVRVRWRRSRDLQTGIAWYELQRRTLGTTRWLTETVTLGSATNATLAYPRPVEAFDLRIRAIDMAGNAGSWSPVVRVRVR